MLNIYRTEEEIKKLLNIKQLKSRIAIDNLRKAMVAFKTLNKPKSMSGLAWTTIFISLANYFEYSDDLLEDPDLTWQKLLKKLNPMTNKEIFQIMMKSLDDLAIQREYLENIDETYIITEGKSGCISLGHFQELNKNFINYGKIESLIDESLSALKEASSLIGDKYGFTFKICNNENATFPPDCLTSVVTINDGLAIGENINIRDELPLTMEKILHASEALHEYDDSDAMNSDFHSIVTMIKSKKLKDSLEASLNHKTNNNRQAMKI